MTVLNWNFHPGFQHFESIISVIQGRFKHRMSSEITGSSISLPCFVSSCLVQNREASPKASLPCVPRWVLCLGKTFSKHLLGHWLWAERHQSLANQ